MHNKVVNNAHFRSLGQPTLRFGCPLPQRYVSRGNE